MRTGPITNLALCSLWIFTREFLRDNTMRDAFVRWESELVGEREHNDGRNAAVRSLIAEACRSERDDR
jgi:hypothetical protein